MHVRIANRKKLPVSNSKEQEFSYALIVFRLALCLAEAFTCLRVTQAAHRLLLVIGFLSE